MAHLDIEFMGIKFPNPFVLSSGPPTATGEMVIEAFKVGWGGAVLKTIGLVPTNLPVQECTLSNREKDRRIASGRPGTTWASFTTKCGYRHSKKYCVDGR